jgi:hypothetical protein
MSGKTSLATIVGKKRDLRIWKNTPKIRKILKSRKNTLKIRKNTSNLDKYSCKFGKILQNIRKNSPEN